MLKLTDICVSFGQKPVLNHLSGTLAKGDFVVVVGANGAGKSTLFDVIAGKIRPHKGTVHLDGADITSCNEVQRVLDIGRLFQNTALSSVGSLTVAQNLSMALYKGKPLRLVDGMSSFPYSFIHDTVKSFGIDLEPLLDKPMNSLSGGQRQIIAFIMAVLVPPKVLLLDEPTAALDPQAATKLLSFVSQFVRQHAITTVLITHDPFMARVLGNKLWVLEQKSISKQYEGDAKHEVNPEELIGHVDYQKLKDL